MRVRLCFCCMLLNLLSPSVEHDVQTLTQGSSATLKLCEWCKGKSGQDDVHVVNGLGNLLCTMCIRVYLVDALFMTGDGLDAYELKIIKGSLDTILFACGVLPPKPVRGVTSDVLRLNRNAD